MSKNAKTTHKKADALPAENLSPQNLTAQNQGKKDLKQMLKAEIDRLGEQTRNSKKVDPQALERAKHLAEVIKLQEEVKGEGPKLLIRRLRIAAVFILCLIIASILLVKRVDETEIELDLVLSGLSFEFDQEAELLSPHQLSVLTAERVENLDIVPTSQLSQRSLNPLQVQKPSALSSKAASLNVKFSSIVNAEGKTMGQLSLALSSLPAGSRVFLGNAPNLAQDYILRLESTKVSAYANVVGDIEIAGGGGTEVRHFAVPTQFPLKSSLAELALSFSLEAGSHQAFIQQLEAKGLKLISVKDSGNLGPRNISHVLSGELYLEALNSKQISLRPGEMLRFGSSQGTIRLLELSPESLRLHFRGKVSQMQIGSPENPRSLMPTLFEWIRANQFLGLLWAGTLALFSLGLTFLRWSNILK
ncbi:MAG: hypothetical protein R2880_15495 [Deinococcales bacterium]